MTLFGGESKHSDSNYAIDVNNMADSSGTMFNVTAKNCKDWADTVNKNKFSTLLTEIAEKSRSGKYMLKVRNLPESFKDELIKRNFIVIKGKTIGFDTHTFHFIIWK